MGLHADRARDRDALERKVAKMRAELDVYAALLGQAGQVLADTPEDTPDESSAAGAGGSAGQPSVMVQDHT